MVLFLLLLPVLAGIGEEYPPVLLPLIYRNWPLPTATPLPAHLLISEIYYDPDQAEPEGEWVEVYNAGGLPLSLAHYKLGDEEFIGGNEGMFEFPTEALIAPGKTLVIANWAVAFKASFGRNPDFELRDTDPQVPDLHKYTLWASGSISLDNSGDEVLLVNPGNQVIDAASWGSSNYAFYPSAQKVSQGHSLERIPPNHDTNSALDWKDQSTPAPGGVAVILPTSTPTRTPTITPTNIPLTPSPTGSLTPTFPSSPTPTFTPTPPVRVLLISEVMYFPGIDQQYEWIELYNRSAVRISLSGYKIGDEESRGGGEGMVEFPADASLGPYGTLVIAHSANKFITKYGFRPDFELVETDFDVPNLASYTLWGLSVVNLGNLGDEVLLLDSNDQVADALSWGDSNWAFEPPCPNVAMEHSLERRPANIDTDSAGDWIDQSFPNPGHVTLQPN